MNQSQQILPVRIYHIPNHQIQDLCYKLLMDNNVQNQAKLIRIISQNSEFSFVTTIAQTQNFKQYENSLQLYTIGKAKPQQLADFFKKFQLESVIQQQFQFTEIEQSILQQIQQTPIFTSLKFIFDPINFYKISSINQNTIILVNQIFSQASYPIYMAHCFNFDKSLILAVGIDQKNIQNFQQKLEKSVKIDFQWVNDTMKELIPYEVFNQLNVNFNQLSQAQPVQFIQETKPTNIIQNITTLQDDKYPCVMIQINNQEVDPDQLIQCLLNLNQVQLNQQLIKQVQIDYFFYFSLLIQINQNEYNQIKQKITNFQQSCIIYNNQIPINTEQLKKHVGQKNVSKFQYSLDEVKLGKHLNENQNYEQLQNYLALQFAFVSPSLNIDQVNQRLDTYLTQYSVKQYQNYYGISLPMQKSIKFWQVVVQNLNTSQFCALQMNKQLFQNNFELYKKLLSTQILPRYNATDYRSSLSQQIISTIMQQSSKLKISEADINSIANIIVFDFEFFVQTSTTIIPFEVGVVRMGNGKILAAYQAFLIPDQQMIQFLDDKEIRHLQKSPLQPLNTNMVTNTAYRQLQPISMQQFVTELFIFMEKSGQELSANINPQHLYIYNQHIAQQKPDYFISKGNEAEKKVFYNIRQTFIAENIQEFQNLIQSVKKDYKQPQADLIHNQQMNQHKCLYHQSAGNHCALNDVINLGAIITAELFMQ